jgi:hypothetical protein
VQPEPVASLELDCLAPGAEAIGRSGSGAGANVSAKAPPSLFFYCQRKTKHTVGTKPLQPGILTPIGGVLVGEALVKSAPFKLLNQVFATGYRRNLVDLDLVALCHVVGDAEIYLTVFKHAGKRFSSG